MRVVLICESMFGNTEVVAGAVAAGLSAAGAEVTFLEVGDAVTRNPRLADYDLLVVAAPTHALSLSRPESRAEAVQRGADPRREQVGVREWLATLDDVLPASGPRPVVAVFTTRVLKAKHWPGSAASRTARTFRGSGFTVVDRAAFYVEGISGPLAHGEVQRARRWAAGLVDAVARVRVASHEA